MTESYVSSPWGIRPLVFCLLIWMLGNACGGLAILSFMWGFLGAGLGLLWFAVFWYRRWFGWSLGFCMAWFFLGVTWGGWDRTWREQLAGKKLSAYLNHKIWAEGWIQGGVERVYPPLPQSPPALSSSLGKKSWNQNNATMHRAIRPALAKRVGHGCEKSVAENPSDSLFPTCQATLILTRIGSVVHPSRDTSHIQNKAWRFWPLPRDVRWRQVQAKVWLKVRDCRDLQRGSVLRLRMQLREPRFYGNPGAFDSKAYWFNRGIFWHVSVRSRDITWLGLRPQDSFWRRADQIRRRISQWLRDTIKHPDTSGLLQALLLGERGQISTTVRHDFAQTGTSHLLAISGLHMAIVCSLLWFVMRWIFSYRRRWLEMGWSFRLAAWATLPGAWWYAWLSGASVSTQRALIMIQFFLLSVALRQSREIGTTLFLSAFFILLLQPMSWSSLSFQLSFGAVVVLCWGNQWFHTQDPEHSPDHFEPPSFWKKVGTWLFLAAWTSALVTLATLPLTLQFFPQVPLWSPLVNLVAIPLGGYCVVGLGLFSVFVWFLSPPVAAWILSGAAWCAQGLLAWVHACTHLPGSQWTLPPLRLHEWLGYYLALAILLRWVRFRRVSVLACLALFLIGASGMILPQITGRSVPTLTVQFLDVGQGDAALIRFPQGKIMLVDAGGAPFGDWDIGTNVLLPALRAMRIPRIDIAVLSHPHPDHFGGFQAVAEHLSIGEFWHTGLSSHHPKFQKLMKTLQQRKIPMRIFRRPQTLTIQGVSVEILHPFPGRYEGETYYWVLHANDNSLVMRLTLGKVRLLFTGDIETRAEEILTERWSNLKADVLKVPHHGSRTSSTKLLLDRVQPKHALFGMGRGNTFGFPHPSVLARYQKRNIRIWRTDQHGMIAIQTDGKSLQIKPFWSPINPAH